MVQTDLKLKISKDFKIEVAFFLIYFYGISLLSSFEYNFLENHITGIPFVEMESILVYGTFNLVSFLIFYKALKHCLKKNKFWTFIILICCFLIFNFFYKKACYLLISHLFFLSDKIRSDAIKWYHLKRLGYTVSYLMIQLFGVGFLAYFTHSAKQNEQLKELKEQQLISELTYLKAQLQPHFFFNTLNNIYSLALQKSDHTAPLTAKLAVLMRYILYSADEILVPLTKEIAFVRNYVEVENIRYRSAIKISMDVQGIDSDSKIGPLLLLPFIENAFKHGIQEEEKEGFVHIVICKVEKELTLEVTNSIATYNDNIGGIGLVNVKKRLEILYSQNHTLVIQNNGKIHHVSLTLKIR